MILITLVYLLIILLILGIFYYSIEQLTFYRSLKKIHPHHSITEPLPKVSIVVFFDSFISFSQTLEQLLKQTYSSSFDIWLVGKESHNFISHPQIQILPINDLSSLKKLDVLKTIASVAEGDLICSIQDGDLINSKWLYSMAREFEPGIEMVKASIHYSTPSQNYPLQKSLLIYKLFFDLLEMTKIIRQKKLFISTDNTSFLKSFLLSNTQTIFLKKGRIQATNNPDTLIEKKFVQERVFSLNGFVNTAQKNTSIFIKAFFVMLNFSVFFCFFHLNLLFTILFCLILKLSVDFLFIIRGMKNAKALINWKTFLFFELLHTPLITISCLVSLYRFLRMPKQGSLH